ncbi:TetR/AcrR family transcriptional regulator [Micromonospora sp. RTGN7]|uniref:TetR/AcrR family transcriptional regulator n=1 Tax=Micromonospora sp. RTGN7 TaxID=3016526 RepID=UPI0029FF2594|nr:TetR/AcrR family transcriptional regulator C-terminal domain-containing protein [Micromonospora sp. RTGN7]
MTSVPKRRRGRPPLPLDRIIETALVMIDHDGPDQFSFRGLADRLSSSTATLYRHVKDKSELLGLVIERTLADVDLPEAADEQWDETCRTTMCSVFASLTKHPGVARILIQQFPSGPHAAAIRERVLHALIQGGFGPGTAAVGGATLARYTLGFAVQAALESAHASDNTVESNPLMINQSRYPSTAAVAHLLPKPLAEEFDFGLRLLLQGLRSMRDEGQSP